MKKIYNTAQNGSFRRWVKQMFASLLKRQDHDYLKEIFEKLQDIEDSIEIIARQIARQIKSGE
jgi:uncharacterized protein YaaN involved in tellurite resistance